MHANSCRCCVYLLLRVQKVTKAKWWSQDPYNRFYQAAATSITKHWKVAPNFVCEGGTLRVTPFLEEVRFFFS